MGNKFYVPGWQRAAQVNDLFSAIASRYDLINDLQSLGLHRYWKRLLFRLARVQPQDRVLDLCCGTGDVARGLTPSGAKIIGLDFSAPMLAVARQWCLRTKSVRQPAATLGTQTMPGQSHQPMVGLQNRPSVLFVQGDALKMPFIDSQFDVVTISYGLRNLADLEAGLRETQRVAKPGGRVLVLDFGKPRNRIWRACYFAYLRWLVPWFGRLFCGDSATYAYILESLEHYPAQEGVAAIMRGLKFGNIRLINLLGGMMSINYGQKAYMDGPAAKNSAT